MDFQIVPFTEAGRRFVAIAEDHARNFASRADQHDREGSFPFENIEALRRSGAAGATVPVELGGLGVASIHDYVVGVNRLGRGDGSTALAANMHIFRTWFIGRAWRVARATGDEGLAARSEQLLRKIARGEVIIAAILSEAGVDQLHLRTGATRTDGGWLLNGRKSFGTGSPAADLLGILCRYQNEDGNFRMGFAHVSTKNPGVEIKNNWDALGMRASGSQMWSSRIAFSPSPISWIPAPGVSAPSGISRATSWERSGSSQCSWGLPRLLGITSSLC